MAVAVFALVGFLIAGYLLLYKFNVLSAIACGSGSCERVQSSPWAIFVGIPVPVWGGVGYLGIFVLALIGLQPGFVDNKLVSLLLFGSAAFAFGFSMYLTYIEAYVIDAWCRWCVASAVAATLVFIAALPEVPRLLKRGDA